MPSVEEEVDKCIECGFCEPRCPSRDLTMTPRQRIVVRREMARLDAAAGGAARRARGGFPVRRAGHLRGRRPLRDGLPGAHRHGRAHEAAARTQPFAGRARGRAARRGRFRGRRAPRCALGAAGRARVRAARDGGHARRSARLGQPVPSGSSHAPAARSLPSATGGRRRRRLLPALHHPHDGRPPRRAGGSSRPAAFVAVAARAGAPVTSPRTSPGRAAACRSRRRASPRRTPSRSTARSSGSGDGRSGARFRS